jgi:hypothetical protein
MAIDYIGRTLGRVDQTMGMQQRSAALTNSTVSIVL